MPANEEEVQSARPISYWEILHNYLRIAPENMLLFFSTKNNLYFTYLSEALLISNNKICFHREEKSSYLSQAFLASLGGSVGRAVRLETRRSRVQPPPRSAAFFPED